MTDVPHFTIPFRFAGARAVVVEQDSVDEIATCVLAVLLCPEGYRVELPEFGLPDQTFGVPGVDLEEIRTVIDLWEPRAATTLEQHPDELDELITRVGVLVGVRSDT